MQERIPGDRKKSSRALTVILCILAVILAGGGVLSWAVLSDPNKGAAAAVTASADAVLGQLKNSVISGQPCSISIDEMNRYLAYRFSSGQKQSGLSDVVILDAEGNTLDCYLPILWKGKKFGVTANVTPSFDPEDNLLLFQVNSVTVGRLPVDSAWALSLAAKYLPSDAAAAGTTVSYTAPQETLTVSGISAKVSLSSLSVEDSRIQIGTAVEYSLTIG